MAADLETPPGSVKDIIARAKRDDVDIVTTSRWLNGGDLAITRALNCCAIGFSENVFAVIWNIFIRYDFRLSRLSDNIDGALSMARNWSCVFHESLVKPLRDGKRVAQIPVKWRRRQEGDSHIAPSEFLRIFRIGLSVRFAAKRVFLLIGRIHDGNCIDYHHH